MYDSIMEMSPFKYLNTLQEHLTKDQPRDFLHVIGLLILADLPTVAYRTALTGTSTFLDAFILCPGLHRQQSAPDLNKGEYPACAAMTTGYVFRVENPATVVFLQKIGRTAHLTTLHVRPISNQNNNHHSSFNRLLGLIYNSSGNSNLIPTTAYLLSLTLTLTTLSLLLLFPPLQDLWSFCILLLLILTRLINTLIIRRRSSPTEVGWKGASEPGVQGDLLILLSQDKWIRLRGEVDDLKAVTSGQWLRDATFFESSLTGFATLGVYMCAALSCNASLQGKVLMMGLWVCSAGLLGVVNEFTEGLRMCGRVVEVKGRSERYKRRLDLAEELVRETGREDWAVRLGMLQPSSSNQKENSEKKAPEGVVTM